MRGVLVDEKHGVLFFYNNIGVQRFADDVPRLLPERDRILLWRRVVKRFFWKFARRSAKLQKAEQWVSRFDTASLFMLSLLPFTPSSFMHFAFGISDFDEKRYLVTMLLGKGVMVAMMALFGQSLVSAMKNPFYLVLAIAIWAGMYFASKHFCKKHEID